MNMEENRKIITDVMNSLARGESHHFADAMDDRMTWRLIGSTSWSGLYTDKNEIRERLFKRLFALIPEGYTNTPKRIHADGDFVIVESEGKSVTRHGKHYNNSYCYVIRMAHGKMVELTEYSDTALIDDALDDSGQ